MIQAPIQFTQGDSAVLNLTATDGDGNPIDLTGATFQTLVNGINNGTPVVFPNSQHEANSDQVSNTGQYTLTLSEDDTASCGLGSHKEILTQITIGGNSVYYRGFNTLQVYAPVPFE